VLCLVLDRFNGTLWQETRFRATLASVVLRTSRNLEEDCDHFVALCGNPAPDQGTAADDDDDIDENVVGPVNPLVLPLENAREEVPREAPQVNFTLVVGVNRGRPPKNTTAIDLLKKRAREAYTKANTSRAKLDIVAMLTRPVAAID